MNGSNWQCPWLKSLKLGSLVLLSFFGLLACQPESKSNVAPQSDLPIAIKIGHFPPMAVPANRPLTAKRIALGKKLFEDPLLSKNNTISCATCHLTPLAFTDGVPVSTGTEGRKTKRNSPTLFNLAWHPYFFMDGGNPTLESQLLGPIEEHSEMDLPFTEAMERVANHPEYPALFQAAFADGVNPFTLTTALSTYERSLVSYASAFDRFYYQGDSSALSPSAQRGLDLFVSAELQCQSCHTFPLTTNFSFENNGLKADYSNDPGRARVTEVPQDVGKFKVPTLRNIELTAPYLHDGSLQTLEAVIDRYAQGGSQHHNQSEKVKGFSLTAQQKLDLVAFLQSLTDTSSFRKYQ
jgi:cytochrome c peroxidase